MWSEPRNLGCAPYGPNSELDEQGPSYVEAGCRSSLYFSRSSVILGCNACIRFIELVALFCSGHIAVLMISVRATMAHA